MPPSGSRSSSASKSPARRQRRAARQRRRRRLRAADAVDRDAARGEQRELVEAPVDVDLLDRPHPRLRRGRPGRAGSRRRSRAGSGCSPRRSRAPPRAPRAAARSAAPARSASRSTRVSMIRLKKKSDLRLRLRRAVAAQRVRRVGPEEARALAAHRHVLVGDRAEVVLAPARSRSRSRGRRSPPPRCAGCRAAVRRIVASSPSCAAAEAGAQQRQQPQGQCDPSHPAGD